MSSRSGLARAATPMILALCLLAGCTSGSEPDPPDAEPSSIAPPDDPPPVPDEPDSSQSLIAADLETDEIDLGTSLQLRAWALFADPRLPARYDGSGSTGHDETLHDDIAASLGTLSEDQRSELAGYLLRPSDPSSPFSAPGAFRSSPEDEAQRCSSPRRWFSKDWSPDGSDDLGFRVWACGPSRATVNDDIDAVLAVGSRLWGPMTKPAPSGMGRPVPDLGAKESDGNGKVDVYLLEPLAECRVRGDDCTEMPDDSVAAAPQDRPLNCSINGFPARACSGYMIVGRGRLDTPAFAADFAHEFFHLLQLAHNGQVDHTWYHEASAVWAEWNYEQKTAKPQVHQRFEAFQTENRSLLWHDPARLFQYRAWVWPLFQATELGASSVFATWRGIESAVTRGDVDSAIDDVLPFADEFRNFAVRNAQPAAYVWPGSTGLDRWQTRADLGDFPTDPHIVTARPTPVRLGRSAHPADVDPLTAQYDEYQITDRKIRQVVIDISKLTDAAQADLDVLARVGTGKTWRRFPGRGGKVTLCRDTAGEDVSFFQVVVSNHVVARVGNLPDLTKRVRGSYAVEGKKKCDPREHYLVGTITWTAARSDGFLPPRASGRLDLVLHDRGGGAWAVEPGSGSTYTYDVEIKECAPDGHLTGEIVAGAGDVSPDWHIASVLVRQADGPDTMDLLLTVHLFDQWEVTCTNAQGESYPYTASGNGLFPGCTEYARVIAQHNDTGVYSISCDVAVPGLDTWSGHVSGELVPHDAPP